jgi:hypothetical protein
MTKFRYIFERFQNLNLIVLIEDLRRNLVSIDRWIAKSFKDGSNLMCPLAHGWRSFAHGWRSVKRPYLSLDIQQISEFTTWWDGMKEDWTPFPVRRQELISLLEGILSERMIDADAVQKVTNHDYRRRNPECHNVL